MDLQVKKKDGSLEPWDSNKILKSITFAGVPQEEVESVVTLIEAYAKRSARNSIISSVEIRSKILILLHQFYPAVAIAFESYKKS